VQVRSRGFPIVEPLAVILVIGVLAAIAVPKFQGAKRKAAFATVKSDLRNLATAREAYFQSARTYYDGPVPAPGTEFTASAGVTIAVIDVSTTGWAATATHMSAPGSTCAVFYGTASAVAPAATAGEIACQ
jgi:Tfp pilus assembly protein PilE